LIGVEKVVDNVDALENGEIIGSVSDSNSQANTVLVKIENRQPIKFTLKPITIKTLSKKLILPVTISGNSMNAVVDSTSKYSYCPASARDKLRSVEHSTAKNKTPESTRPNSNHTEVTAKKPKSKSNEDTYLPIKIGNFEVYHLFYFSNSTTEHVTLGMDFVDILDKNGILLTPESGLDGLQLNPEYLPLSNCQFESSDLYAFAKIFNLSSDLLTIPNDSNESSDPSDPNDQPEKKDVEKTEKRKKRVDKLEKLRLKLFSDDQNASLYSMGDVLVVNFDSQLYSCHSNQSALFEIEGITMSKYDRLLFATPSCFVKGFAYKNPIVDDI